jgi:hypothetical protein
VVVYICDDLSGLPIAGKMGGTPYPHRQTAGLMKNRVFVNLLLHRRGPYLSTDQVYEFGKGGSGIVVA